MASKSLKICHVIFSQGFYWFMCCTFTTPNPHGESYSQLGGMGAFVRTGHAEVEQELRLGVYRPRVMSFVLSGVKGKTEAQPLD